jgi:hypothetical protein
MDGGANSAVNAAEHLGITDTIHQMVPIRNLNELKEAINVFRTDKEIYASVDNIVIDSLVEINSFMYDTVSRLPRYNADTLHVDEVMLDNPNKSADGRKTMALYGEVQKMTLDLIQDLLTMKSVYNIIVLAGEITIDKPEIVPTPTVYPKVNGPKSSRPVISLFDEVYRTKFDPTIFDTKDNIHTSFTLSKYVDDETNFVIFNKTRNIKNLEYLQANQIPADFRLIYKEIGYNIKSNRKKTK